MTKKKAAPKTPRTVQTEAQLCAMPRDNINIGKDWWMMLQQSVGGFEVVLTKQRRGEMPSAQIKIPRRVFTKMADWFNAGTPSRRHKPQPRTGDK